MADPILDKPTFKTFVFAFKQSRISFSWGGGSHSIAHSIPLIFIRLSGNMEFANHTIIVSREPVATSAIDINSRAHIYKYIILMFNQFFSGA